MCIFLYMFPLKVCAEIWLRKSRTATFIPELVQTVVFIERASIEFRKTDQSYYSIQQRNESIRIRRRKTRAIKTRLVARILLANTDLGCSKANL